MVPRPSADGKGPGQRGVAVDFAVIAALHRPREAPGGEATDPLLAGPLLAAGER